MRLNCKALQAVVRSLEGDPSPPGQLAAERSLHPRGRERGGARAGGDAFPHAPRICRRDARALGIADGVLRADGDLEEPLQTPAEALEIHADGGDGAWAGGAIGE